MAITDEFDTETADSSGNRQAPLAATEERRPKWAEDLAKPMKSITNRETERLSWPLFTRITGVTYRRTQNSL